MATFLVILGPAEAEIVVTTDSSPDEIAFDSLIQATDLINIGQTSYATSTTTTAPDSGFTLNGTHDGGAASYLTNPQLAFARNTYFSGAETTLTFFLNTNRATGGNVAGYTLQDVTVFAGWKDENVFAGQRWAFRVATLTNTGFTEIQTVTYSPPAGSKSSVVSITNAAAPVASGVTAVQFQIEKLSDSGIVIREIDLLGFPTPPPPPPPPSLPAGLTAMGSTGLTNAHVTLFWTPAPDADGYQILREESTGAGYSVIGASATPAFTDTTAENDRTYTYVIASTNVSGNACCSFPASATTSAQAALPLRILCIGDGNTAGYTDNPTWRIPFEFGYRSGLYLRMTTNGHPVQFVGTSAEPWNGGFGLPTNTPSPDLRLLDQDHHRGYAGANTSFVAVNMDAWMAFDHPDILLINVGIDDHDLTLARSNLTKIVETIVTRKPDAITILAQVTPMVTYSQFIVDYNRLVRDTLVPAFQARGWNVFTVDLYASLLTNGAIDPSLFSNGFNHPGITAYDRMAQSFYEGIQSALTRPRRATITSVTVDGNNLILSGTGGQPHGLFSIVASESPARPDADSEFNLPVKRFDSSGRFTWTNSIASGKASRFFRIKLR